jgi:mannose-6-phosphate isomerase-like protein (cupin superfamily)
MSDYVGLIDLLAKVKTLSGDYQNIVIARINDHVLRMSRMTESYFWHFHPNSDEAFIGVEGTVILELETQRIELSAGQMFIVPKGVKHRTSPAGTYSINLTFERSDMETVLV